MLCVIVPGVHLCVAASHAHFMFWCVLPSFSTELISRFGLVPWPCLRGGHYQDWPSYVPATVAGIGRHCCVRFFIKQCCMLQAVEHCVLQAV